MRDKASVFVGNLAMFCTESDIKKHFIVCGEITDVSIKCDPKTGRQLSYGFVRFTKEKTAKIAVETMNGSLLCGRSLRVGKALKEKSEADAISSTFLFSIPSVHVSYKAFQVNRIVNEESLRALYSQYGEVLDVTIKHATVDQEGNYQSGYGFIHYSSNEIGINSAFEAVKCLMDTVIEDVNYISKISHALEKHLTLSGQSSNESVSSLDEDSWFELSTVDMNFNETHGKNDRQNGHRRISSADTWVNNFQTDGNCDSQTHRSNDAMDLKKQSQEAQYGQFDGYQSNPSMMASPSRMGHVSYMRNQTSPCMVPMQMQPQFVSYQLPPQMLPQQIPPSSVMPTYIYQPQTVYQPIYVSSQPSTMLFPAQYCYNSMSSNMTQSPGIAYSQMQGNIMDPNEYSNYQHMPMQMQQMPVPQTQMYIPVSYGYSPNGTTV